jgi:PEP-CTERM motif
LFDSVQNNDVTNRVLGIDAFLMSNDLEPNLTAFGVVIYNNPSITGFVITQDDLLDMDLGPLTNFPNGTPVSYAATLVVASEPVPEPSTLILLIGAFGLFGCVWRRRQTFNLNANT